LLLHCPHLPAVQTPYLDLLLIHLPTSKPGPNIDPPFIDTWRGIEALVDKVLVLWDGWQQLCRQQQLQQWWDDGSSRTGSSSSSCSNGGTMGAGGHQPLWLALLRGCTMHNS